MEQEITELLKHGEFEIGYLDDEDRVYIYYTLYWIEKAAGIKDEKPLTDVFNIIDKKTLNLIQKWWDIEEIFNIKMQESYQENPEDHFYIELTEKGQRLKFIQQTNEIFKVGCTLIIKPSETSECNIFLDFHDEIISKKTIELVETVWDIMSIQVGSTIDEIITPILELKEKNSTTSGS